MAISMASGGQHYIFLQCIHGFRSNMEKVNCSIVGTYKPMLYSLRCFCGKICCKRDHGSWNGVVHGINSSGKYISSSVQSIGGNIHRSECYQQSPGGQNSKKLFIAAMHACMHVQASSLATGRRHSFVWKSPWPTLMHSYYMFALVQFPLEVLG